MLGADKYVVTGIQYLNGEFESAISLAGEIVVTPLELISLCDQYSELSTQTVDNAYHFFKMPKHRIIFNKSDSGVFIINEADKSVFLSKNNFDNLLALLPILNRRILEMNEKINIVRMIFQNIIKEITNDVLVDLDLFNDFIVFPQLHVSTIKSKLSKYKIMDNGIILEIVIVLEDEIVDCVLNQHQGSHL